MLLLSELQQVRMRGVEAEQMNWPGDWICGRKRADGVGCNGRTLEIKCHKTAQSC